MAEKQLSEKAKKFMEAAKAAGLSEDRLKKYESSPVMSNILPKVGKFGTYSFAGEIVVADTVNNIVGGDFRHPRMNVEGTSDSISFSAIKLIALGKDAEVHFKKSAETSKLKGGYVLSGGRAVNPRLVLSEAELAAHLEGKSFTADEVDVRILPYKDGGHQVLPTEKDLVVKSVYKITITD